MEDYPVFDAMFVFVDRVGGAIRLGVKEAIKRSAREKISERVLLASVEEDTSSSPMEVNGAKDEAELKSDIAVLLEKIYCISSDWPHTFRREKKEWSLLQITCSSSTTSK